MEHFSLWELYEVNLKLGLIYWGPRRIYQIRLWKWGSVPIGAPFWETWGRGTLLS